MGIFVLTVVVVVCMLLGAASGAALVRRSTKSRIERYEREREEQERRRAELSADLFSELTKIRNGLAGISAAYEDVVGVVEREFGAAEDLHLRLIAPEPPLVLEHKPLAEPGPEPAAEEVPAAPAAEEPRRGDPQASGLEEAAPAPAAGEQGGDPPR